MSDVDTSEFFEPEVSEINRALSGTPPPARPRPVVSAFADWIFHAMTPSRDRFRDDQSFDVQRRERRREGVFAHSQLDLFFRVYSSPSEGRLKPRDWELVFADPHDSETRVFFASRLCVNGEPLRGVPDAVLRNRKTGTILIIERKFTRTPAERIRKSGWPNLRAQLWCYGMLDEWRDAPEVRLLGQIWHISWQSPRRRTKWDRGIGARCPYSNVNLSYRQLTRVCPEFRRDAPGFFEPWRFFFDRYGGRVIDG